MPSKPMHPMPKRGPFMAGATPSPIPMPADATDAEPERALISRLLEGDDSAFDEVVRRHQEPLLRFALGLLGDLDEAADVVQETFICAYERIAGFRGGSTLYTWLYRIAYNRSISLLRRRKVRRLLRLDRHGEDGEGEGAGVRLQLVAADDPGADLERAERMRQVERAIASLPPRQRSIFVMRHFEGLSHGEIARIAGRSEGAIRAGYFHAVRKVRDAVRRAGLLDTEENET